MDDAVAKLVGLSGVLGGNCSVVDAGHDTAEHDDHFKGRGRPWNRRP